MTLSLNEETDGAGFCLGCQDKPVVQARLLVWRSEAFLFGLGSWRWMAWLKSDCLFLDLLAACCRYKEHRTRKTTFHERKTDTLSC